MHFKIQCSSGEIIGWVKGLHASLKACISSLLQRKSWTWQYTPVFSVVYEVEMFRSHLSAILANFINEHQ